MPLPRPLRSLPAVLGITTALAAVGCSLVPDHWWPGRVRDESAVLARVGERELRESAIGNLIAPGTPPTDSLRILQDYVQRWTREASVLNQAAVDLEDDPDIDRLVEDYRASLQRHRLEERLIHEGVDTVISAAELAARYAEMSEDYATPHELVRALLVKVPRESQALDEFDSAWQQVTDEEIPQQLRTLSANHADLALLNPKQWFESAELQALLPKSVDDIARGSRVTTADDHRYYLRLLERVDRGDRSPLAYLEPRLRKMILEERRASFLQGHIDQIYRDAKAKNEVQIYVGRE